MSDFNLAFPVLLEHEGGFVNNPKDPGGATKYGISLRFLKGLKERDASGFLVGDLDHDGDVDIDDIKALTPDTARTLYFLYFWNKYGYARIEDQHIATKLFLGAANMGAIQACKLLQRACIEMVMGASLIIVDGRLGTRTLAIINSVKSTELLKFYREKEAAFYEQLVDANPHFEQFKKGWLKRAYA